MSPSPTGRAWRRRAWYGLQTLFGGAPRGFFIPYRYAADLPGAGQRGPYPALETLLREREPAFGELIDEVDGLADDLERIGDAPPPAPRWSQDWFPPLDAAVAYTLVRGRRPRRILEIGSGHSTRFLCRAVADGGLETAITAIDPAPRADLADLPLTLRRETLPLDDLAPFEDLQSGDFLLIDSSHILMPGSDVDFLLCRVLPLLPAGAWVQFHDIFLPEDYPASWAWRGYNEQLGLVPLLQGGGWRVRFASHYVSTAMEAAVAASVVGGVAAVPGARNSAFWLEKLA